MSQEKLFYPKNDLREKAEAPGGLTFEEAVKRGEQRLSLMKADYENWLNQDLNILEEFVKELETNEKVDDLLPKIKTKVHDIRSQGETFGYPLISAIAHSLCRLLIDFPEGKIIPKEIIRIHVDSLRLVTDKKVDDAGGAAGRTLLTSLDAMVDKFVDSSNI